MEVTKEYIKELTYRILGSAIEVHKQLGPGLLESLYEKCLKIEFSNRNIFWSSQQAVPITYKGNLFQAELRYDLLVEDSIIVEVKSVEGLLPVHDSILLTYMKLLEKPKGILINFNCKHLFKEGQRTLVNEYFAKLPN